jgi:hypothetical protein
MRSRHSSRSLKAVSPRRRGRWCRPEQGMVPGVVAAAACVLAMLVAPAFARAGTFTALSCHDAAGAAIGTRGWGVGKPEGGYITFGDGCAGGGAGAFGLSMGPDPTANYGYVDGDAMTYAVPAGLAILGYDLRLDAYGGPCGIQSGQCANGFGDVFVNHTGQSDPNYDYRNLGYGRQEPTVSVGELSGVDSVTVGVGCDPGQDLSYECPGSSTGGPEAQALIGSGSFTLLDSTVPTVANVTGSLLAGGTLTGSDTVNFTASNSGGGIYSASVLVDGRQVVGEVPNTNAGLCVDLAAASSATMAFAAPQPCPSTENVSLTVNTSAISAGQHHLQVLVTDAAGDEATAYDGTITTAGPSGSSTGGAIGPGSPLALRGAANGTNASDEAKLTARWQGTSKATRTSRYGQADRVTGRLTSATGQPISGALLDVTATDTDQGARAASLESVRTGPTGAWSSILPRDVSSSAVRFVYRSHVNDTIPVAAATLTLRVHAGIALAIAPHVTSVGRTIVFTGTLHGAPIPPGGKQLVLEASSGREWIQFRTIATAAKGRFHASYRFKFLGPIAYRFRVLSPYEADFPFLAGTSNVVGVYER